MVHAADQPGGVDVAAMRQAEGRLFGHAWLENDRDARGQKVAARRSAIRLRLSDWSLGDMPASRWESLSTVRHPEVANHLHSERVDLIAENSARRPDRCRRWSSCHLSLRIFDEWSV